MYSSSCIERQLIMFRLLSTIDNGHGSVHKNVTCMSRLTSCMSATGSTSVRLNRIFPCAQFKKHEEVDGEERVPYSYGLFHFVFAVGAMYLAMLFVGWNLHQTMHR